VRGFLKFLVLIVFVAGLMMVADHDGGRLAGFAGHDLHAPIYQVGVLVLFGAAVTALFPGRLGAVLQRALLWGIACLALVVACAYQFELREAGERVLAELAPVRASARGHTVEIIRSVGGEFRIATQVNDARVVMVLDTGATAVMLTREAAIAAGLPAELIRYTVRVDTANGHAYAAALNIDRLAIGGIVARSVPALIAPPGQLKVSLLGMSFLSRLQSWEVRGDRIALHGPP
jgi:aspartyl protease family protein